MTHAYDYLVVAGSTRPTRRSPAIAKWVADLGEEVCGARFRVVDLRELELGHDDEPDIPAGGAAYVSPATQRWSDLVSAAKGVVFVTPQYNWGYPAPLKNAIDHLYREWKAKPALIVSYGSQGGDKCAAQLREVLGGMGLSLTGASPGLRLARARIEANDGAVEPDVDFDAHRDEVRAALRELAALVA
ncbi:MAG TPA: NAD(P)H-dependent oxidoreductase [Caulobacteraceae bacterium]|jgi:NAD(P)H-dependent FMN reductase